MHLCTYEYVCVFLYNYEYDRKLQTSLSTADEIRGEGNRCYLLPNFAAHLTYFLRSCVYLCIRKTFYSNSEIKVPVLNLSNFYLYINVKVKRQSNPETGLCGLEGSGRLRLLDF
jgi:hypothetical protein